MEILVRKSKHRVNIYDPEHTDPSWRSAYEVGQKRIKDGKLKFENRGEEERSWKEVNANPANVPGLAPFFPRLPRIQEMVHLSSDGVLTEAEILHRFIEKASRNKDIDLFCPACDEVTSHAIGRSSCFCHTCGRFRKERLM